ncbi:MAG TPA: hypothetical protein VGM82_22830 [Gemmatimonadaceae bacterium]|jgi:hypothetical protein
MSTAMKSLVLLSFTLVVGFALGLFADAMLFRQRRDRINNMRRPPGLVEHLERVIQPHDSTQAAAIRPILQHAVDNNQQVIRQSNERLRVNMDSLRVALDSSLDAGQRQRLAGELTRMSQMGGPGGFGGRGRGGRGGRRGGGGPPDGPPGSPPGAAAGQPPAPPPS